MIQAEVVPLKAIPTTYKGFQVRSRLEGRWLVFLDYLNIPWEYEKEGYQLGDSWYVPDLYLPEIDWWVEIKPENATEADMQKASAFADLGRQNIVVLSGQPRVLAESKPAFRMAGFIGEHTRVPTEWYLGFVCGRHSVGDLRDFLLMRSKEGLWLTGPVPEYDGSEDSARVLYELDRVYFRNRYGKDHPRRKGCGNTCTEMGWRRYYFTPRCPIVVPDWMPGEWAESAVAEACNVAMRYRFW